MNLQDQMTQTQLAQALGGFGQSQQQVHQQYLQTAGVSLEGAAFPTLPPPLEEKPKEGDRRLLLLIDGG